MTKRKIRITIVDDHALFREGVRDILSNQPDFEVVGEAGDGQEALSLAADKNPDVMLMDLRLPRLGGVMAIKRIREAHEDVKIIVVTMCEDDDHKREAILAGADAYLSKMEESEVVLDTIRKLMRGRRLISDQMRTEFEKEREVEIARGEAPMTLTDMEQRVLEGLCRGKSNRDLAGEFCMCERTLKNHLNSVFRKLGVKTRLEAVARGIQKRLVSLTS